MTEGNFADVAKIFIQSGNGGRGSSHLRREKYVAKGGPDGGDGGNGGDIIFRGNQNLWTLYKFKFKRHFCANHGGNGGKSRSSGTNGEDLVIDVPLGTVIKNLETSEIIAEISDHKEKIIVLKGGKGGLGNWHFRSSVRQTPTYAQKGLPGAELQIILELKILADVGLVGFPNAGKSTLLATLSAAKPKIASYEFTTLKPSIGIVPYRDYRSFVMADIPGIIEKASEGKGLGHRFLRHIERNSVLLFLIPFQEDSGIESYIDNYNILLRELNIFNANICKKEGVFALTKCDLISKEREKMEISLELEKKLNLPVLLISSHTSEGLVELKDLLWKLLNH